MHSLLQGGSSTYKHLKVVKEYRPAQQLQVVSPSIHDCHREHCERVIINISGQRFETQMKTLLRYPHTLLGNDKKREMFWDRRRNEYFFDRHRPSFCAILNFYQSGGRLRRPFEVPDDIFYEEIQFFQLDKPVIREYLLFEGYAFRRTSSILKQNLEDTWRNRIWKVLECPNSSLFAKLLGVINVFVIMLSVFIFCIETIPHIRMQRCLNASDKFGNWTSKINRRDKFFLIETSCICWFLADLFLRFSLFPWPRRHFFKSFMNWLDIFAVVPFFINFIPIENVEHCADKLIDHSVTLLCLRITRLLRVVRVFKLSKYVVCLRILGKTLLISLKELSMFMFLLVISVIFFASFIYMAESNFKESRFGSIPDAFWWAVISMTTVGYGDYVPTGIYGKLVGSVCVVAGVLTIALPVPVIVTNFNTVYKQATKGKV